MGLHEKTKTSLNAPFPSMEFIPIMDYDTDSVHSTDSACSMEFIRFVDYDTDSVCSTDSAYAVDSTRTTS